MFVLAFISTLYIKMGSGPEWNISASLESKDCQENWWINALYLNNIVRTETMCHRVSWYLAADMQLFIVSVPLVYLLIKKPEMGRITLWIFLVASLVIPFCVVYYHHLDPILLTYSKSLRDFGTNHTYRTAYIPSYMRATPYFIGILTGYLVHYLNNSNKKISVLQANCMQIGAFILGFLPLLSSSMFYQSNFVYNPLIAAAFSSLQRLSWGTSILFGFLVFNAGKEWSVMKILSAKVFVPLGKLTYSAYLVHILPQFYDAFSAKTLVHISWYGMIHQTLGDVVIAYSLAFVLSMAIEAPWLNMEKFLLRKYQPSAVHGKSESTQSSDHKCSLMKDIEKPV
ncbi:nose resistant to fluoxetine protein 6-like [Ischnura elegans]|uniref:nose resistant to fluoxetine protein 6-like n=1 Tax=Ischnura elegans TaxID=197161 RepID=UPI001ED87B81|nr:nose resistant to fluoxetine protein 6-like [Ischnura elegans]